jgi:hypothetical protein
MGTLMEKLPLSAPDTTKTRPKGSSDRPIHSLNRFSYISVG